VNEDYQEAFDERAGILEYDAGYSRTEAEGIVRRILSENELMRRFRWRTLLKG